jgi:hypothetical protein
MSDNFVPKKRTVTPPPWIVAADGRKTQLQTARWSLTRVAELFVEEPHRVFTVDDLARLVYGSNGKRNRQAVRKHVPLQRNHMLGRLNPIVTRYGARGIILAVKLYDRAMEEDRACMQAELEQLRSRKELSEEKYHGLRGLLGLP